MMRLPLRRVILLVGATVFGPLLMAAAAEPPSESQAIVTLQKPCQLDRDVKVHMKYLLQLPNDYDQQESLPVLLFLHGAGERGDNLDLVKKHGPPKLIEAGQEFPFIVVSPQCPEGRWWEPFELAALLDEIVEKYKVDQDRIYVTGLSMGGFGTWSLAAYQPKRFAAIVPICGGGEPFTTRLFAKVPAWVFHGAKDFGGPLGTVRKNGRSDEEGGRQCQIHRLPGSRTRLVDRGLRRPRTVPVAAATETGSELVPPRSGQHGRCIRRRTRHRSLRGKPGRCRYRMRR